MLRILRVDLRWIRGDAGRWLDGLRLLVAQEEIHDRLRVFRFAGQMSLAFLDDDRDRTAELLVALLDNPRLVRKPGVEAAAIVQERYTGLGQRGQVIEWRRLRHEAAENGIPAIDAGHLVRVLDRPGVGFPGGRPGSFQHRLSGEAVVGQELVSGVPLFPHGAGLRGEWGMTM